MNITDALYRAAHNYEHGGIDALALRLGISASSLAHKVSPTYPGAHCSPGELAQICELTGDHSAVVALASRLGYVLIPVAQGNAPAEFSRELAATVREFGQLITETAGALADGRVTDTEQRRIEREGAQSIAAIQQLIALTAKKNQDAKPAAARGLRCA